MFWERFYNLCLEKDTKPNPVAKKIGISSGIVTKWKNEDTLPNGETLLKIADYFNVSVDYLLGRTNDYTKITGSTIIAGKIKDTNTQSDMIKDTSIMGVNIENTNIGGSTYKQNDTEQTITENEAELLKNYRFLSDRNKHKLITISYEMQEDATKI